MQMCVSVDGRDANVSRVEDWFFLLVRLYANVKIAPAKEDRRFEVCVCVCVCV